MKVLFFTPKKFERSGNKSCKSRPFLLLEVIIALTIVSLVAFPLITPHIWMIIEEKKLNNEIETDRNLNLIWAHIVEKFYKNEFSWTDISSEEKVIIIDTNSIPELPKSWPYTVSFTSKSMKEKKGKEAGQAYHLLKISLFLKDSSGKTLEISPYELFVERKIKLGKEVERPPEKQGEEEEPEGSPGQNEALDEPQMEEAFL